MGVLQLSPSAIKSALQRAWIAIQQRGSSQLSCVPRKMNNLVRVRPASTVQKAYTNGQICNGNHHANHTLRMRALRSLFQQLKRSHDTETVGEIHLLNQEPNLLKIVACHFFARTLHSSQKGLRPSRILHPSITLSEARLCRCSSAAPQSRTQSYQTKPQGYHLAVHHRSASAGTSRANTHIGASPLRCRPVL